MKKKSLFVIRQNCYKAQDNIQSIGRSPRNNIYAIAENGRVTTYNGWEGNKLSVFTLPPIDELSISQTTPFNNGLSVLPISPEGIYLLHNSGHTLIHPTPDPDDKEWAPSIHMEHAALSADNAFIASWRSILHAQGP